MSHITFRSLFRRAALGALPFLLIACESPTDVPVPAPAPVVESVEIVAPPGGMVVGDAFQLEAVVRSGDGGVLDHVVTWSTSDTALAVVSSAGVLTARAAGAVHVSATAGGRVGTASVHIRNTTPAVTQLSPASATSGDEGLELTVIGTGFGKDAVVLWNGQPRNTRVISATEIRATITAEDLQSAGVASVLVLNTGEGGGLASATMMFTIEQPPVTWTTYHLEGLESDRTLPVEVSRIEWLDEAGDRHAAVQRVLSGTLRIRRQAGSPTQWEQVVTLATYLEASGAEVQRGHYALGGAVAWDVWTGAFIFRSDMFMGVQFRTTILGPDAFVMYQVLHPSGDEAEEKGWVYVQE